MNDKQGTDEVPSEAAKLVAEIMRVEGDIRRGYSPFTGNNQRLLVLAREVQRLDALLSSIKEREHTNSRYADADWLHELATHEPVTVDAQGVYFGKHYWVSHETITVCVANLIPSKHPQYWEWVCKAPFYECEASASPALDRSDTRTMDEKLSDGARFVAGPGGDEGTRSVWEK